MEIEDSSESTFKRCTVAKWLVALLTRCSVPLLVFLRAIHVYFAQVAAFSVNASCANGYYGVAKAIAGV